MSNYGGNVAHSDHGRPVQHGGASGGGSQHNTAAQHQMFASLPHAQAQNTGSQAAAGGPGATFGGPLSQQQPSQDGSRSGQQGGPVGGVTPGGHQIPGGVTQGQQPILNVSNCPR